MPLMSEKIQQAFNRWMCGLGLQAQTAILDHVGLAALTDLARAMCAADPVEMLRGARTEPGPMHVVVLSAHPKGAIGFTVAEHPSAIHRLSAMRVLDQAIDRIATEQAGEIWDLENWRPSDLLPVA